MPDPALKNDISEKRTKNRRVLLVVIALSLAAILLTCAGTLAIVEFWPEVGARVAVRLRDYFGPQMVARLETVVFQIQDGLKQWQYQDSDQQVDIPWESPQAPRETRTMTSTPPPATPTLLSTPTAAAQDLLTPSPDEDLSVDRLSSPTPSAIAHIWQLSDLEPLGSLEGEGVWQPYLYDPTGNVIAQRTYLQPDPARPYAVVAVVAIDLSATQLHFVLGFTDPGIPDGPKGDGLIPEKHRQPGNLVAAFNGGFRTANGMYGAMADGTEALPPVEGIATIGIYRDGQVRMGSWGEEIDKSPDLTAWRQNCSLVIDTGEISPKVYNDSIVDWGGTISNQIVTKRSGLGLDKTGQTLYYFAGPSLSMPALADAMLASGVHYGMLLDINNFWVHFTAIREEAGNLVAEPLLPEQMIDKIDRYLGASPVDFFYITIRD